MEAPDSGLAPAGGAKAAAWSADEAVVRGTSNRSTMRRQASATSQTGVEEEEVEKGKEGEEDVMAVAAVVVVLVEE